MTDFLVLLDSIGRAAAAATGGPLVVWTLVALLVLGMLRLVPGRPLMQYRIRTGLLFALPLGIGAALLDINLGGLLLGTDPVSWTSPMLAPLHVDPAQADAAASSSPAWRGSFVGIGLLAVGAGSAALAACTRLACDAWALRQFRTSHPPNAPAVMQKRVDALTRTLGIGRSVSVCCAHDISVPMTVGGWRPCLFLPPSLWAEDSDDTAAFDMAVTHELIHVRRFDYTVHALVRLVRALCVAHPLVGRYARSIATYREQACDAAVLANDHVQRKDYATLLLQWAQHTAPAPGSALGLAYSSSTLKSRISHMTSFNAVSRSHPFVSIAISAVLLVGTFGLMACSDVGMQESPDPDPPSEARADGPYKQVDTMPEIDGGMQALYSAVSYPEVAQEHGVGGRVVVQFVVEPDGTTTDLTILTADVKGEGMAPPQSVAEALEDAALEAVRQVTFEPGKHNGDVVDVQMAVPIIFQLPE